MPRSFLVVLRTCHLMPINLRFIFEYTHKKRDFFSVQFYQIVFCQFLYALSFWMFYRNERFMISHIYFAFVDTVIPIKFNALNSFECHGMKVIYSFALFWELMDSKIFCDCEKLLRLFLWGSFFLLLSCVCQQWEEIDFLFCWITWHNLFLPFSAFLMAQ